MICYVLYSKNITFLILTVLMLLILGYFQSKSLHGAVRDNIQKNQSVFYKKMENGGMSQSYPV